MSRSTGSFSAVCDENRAHRWRIGGGRGLSELRGLQRFGDLLLFHRAFADELPGRLGDVHRGGALAGAVPGVQHQVDPAIHHAEDLDAAAARRRSGDVRAGGNERLIQRGDQGIGDFGVGLLEGFVVFNHDRYSFWSGIVPGLAFSYPFGIINIMNLHLEFSLIYFSRLNVGSS